MRQLITIRVIKLIQHDAGNNLLAWIFFFLKLQGVLLPTPFAEFEFREGIFFKANN